MLLSFCVLPSGRTNSLTLFTPSQISLFRIKGNTSLYVMAFLLVIIGNFLLYFIIVAIRSLVRENGPFVTIISQPFRISRHSELLKSPSPNSGVLSPFQYRHHCPHIPSCKQVDRDYNK